MKNIFAVIVVCLIVAAGAWAVYRYTARGPIALVPQEGTQASTTAPLETPPLSSSTPATTQVSADTRGYQNSAFHFGLIFPSNLQATEYKEQAGALTVSFQDPTTNEGFEVYVTPYSGTQIDEQRFKLDEPSGTYLNPTSVLIDGVTASKFNGYNAIMGTTTEVWFIHGGNLYEVATYEQLDTWLGQIMQTWKFI